MKKLFYTLMFIIIFPVMNFGQKGFLPGYIVTNNSDTLRGFISQKSNFENSKSCTFRGVNDQYQNDYFPDDIKAYRIENYKYYVSKEITIDSVKQKVFLEYLVDGIVDLYYIKGVLNDYFFIEKESRLFQLSNEQAIIKIIEKGEKGLIEKEYFKDSNQYKRMLTYMFQDSPSISERISNTTFAYKPLINITKEYHNSVCKDYECIDYTKPTAQGMFIEPYTGIINSWMGLRFKTSHTYSYNLMPYLGANLRITPFKGLYSMNLLLGVSYSRNSFDGVYDALYNSPIQYRIVAEYSILRILLGVNYYFTANKLQPFVSFAYNNIIIPNPDYSVTRVEYSSVIETPHRKYQLGLTSGFGLKYSISQNIYAYLKNEFEFRMPAANFGHVIDYQYVLSHLASFGVGIKIK